MRTNCGPALEWRPSSCCGATVSSFDEEQSILYSAANRSIGSTTGCTITEKAPTRAFSWLKAPTSAFTFKTLLRHYAKRALTPWSLNVKLGPRHNYHKGRAAIRHYANQPANLWIAFVSSSSSYSLWMTRRVVTKQRGAGHCSVFFTTYNLTRLQNNSEWFK